MTSSYNIKRNFYQRWESPSSQQCCWLSKRPKPPPRSKIIGSDTKNPHGPSNALVRSGHILSVPTAKTWWWCETSALVKLIQLASDGTTESPVANVSAPPLVTKSCLVSWLMQHKLHLSSWEPLKASCTPVSSRNLPVAYLMQVSRWLTASPQLMHIGPL